MKVDPTSFTVSSQIFITTLILHYYQHLDESSDFYTLFFSDPILGKDLE